MGEERRSAKAIWVKPERRSFGGFVETAMPIIFLLVLLMPFQSEAKKYRRRFTMKEQMKMNIKDNNAGGTNSVGDYKFEPIRGKPMLKWDGKRPFSSTQYFPAQEKERHGDEVNGWMNRIYWGDNIQVMSHLLKEFRGKVNLIYIDPPFDSKADYKKKIELRGKKVESDHSSFEDKQYTDIWTNDEYLQFMYERLLLCRELMADGASIYLHCDFHKDHFLRVMLDEIFGSENFQREIIWTLAGVSGYKSLVNNFVRGHDTILFYTKSGGMTFNKKFLPYNESQLKRFSCVDENGRRYKPITKDKRIYLDESKGVPLSDVWSDIASFQTIVNSPEIQDYPTQKPEKLIQRIVECSSNPGNIVFDCFMGSGTTQAVAMKLGRKFIGADINLGAIQTTTKRLLGVAEEIGKQLPNSEEPKYTGFTVYNVNNYDVFRNPVEARELLIKALELQPLPKTELWDGEKDGAFYKIMPVNRLATKADLNEIVSNFDYKAAEKEQEKTPGKAIIDIKLVCMGHEPDLGAALIQQFREMHLEVNVEVVDILRDKSNLVFKKDSEAEIVRTKKTLKIKQFYPMNLMKKLSMEKSKVKNMVTDWREMVDSVMIDFNYDGVVFNPTVVDVPKENEFVKGEYDIPENAGTIKVKITDLLSESLEAEVK